MPRTKAEALRKARKFKRMHPDKDVLIIHHTKSSKDDDLRFNFRFRDKVGKRNKILIKKED